MDQLKLLSQSTALEEGSIPFTIKGTISVISFFFLIFILWASLFRVKESVKFTGNIIPNGEMKVISHERGGKIKNIFVNEGDYIERGKILMELDGQDLRQDLKRVESRLVVLNLQEERLKAFLEGRDPNFRSMASIDNLIDNEKKAYEDMSKAFTQEQSVIKEQFKQKKDSLERLETNRKIGLKHYRLAKEEWLLQKRLYKVGLSSKSQYLRAQRDKVFQWGEYVKIKDEIKHSKNIVTEFKSRLDSMESTYKNRIRQTLVTTQQQIQDSLQQRNKLEVQVANLKIRSPVKGIVQGLVANTEGSSISAGRPIMNIFPTNAKLIAEVKISPNDIGHLKLGMEVDIKVTAFDFSRFGSVQGRLVGISPSTFIEQDQKGTAYYKGKVELIQNYVGHKGNQIQSGMVIAGDILSGDKTVMAYFLKPIHKALHSSFHER